MNRKSCFVVMAIGDQHYADTYVSASELRARYDDLIKEALLKADPELDIIRSDDVAAPGTITSDILTRLMHSDIVVADVSYPNPNVFYELGLRHACRTGTAIIRDKNTPRAPFDIAHLRHIEYESSPSGPKKLAEDFRTFLEFTATNPDRPDNHFLELAKLTKYTYPDYSDPAEKSDPETDAMMAVMTTPAVLDVMVRKSAGEEVPQAELLEAMLQNPDAARLMTKAMISSGEMSFAGNSAARSETTRRGSDSSARKWKKRKNKNRKSRKR